MKRGGLILILAIAFALFITESPEVPPVHASSPATVCNGCNYTVVQLCVANGYFWVFALNGAATAANAVYSFSSPDGVTWTNKGALVAFGGASPAPQLGIACSSTTWFIDEVTPSSTAAFWSTGTFGAGSLIVTNNHLPLTLITGSQSSIAGLQYGNGAIDTHGNLWFCIPVTTGGNSYIDVYEYASGAWGRSLDQTTGANLFSCSITALTSGNVGLEYQGNGVTNHPTAKIFTGSWGSSVSDTTVTVNTNSESGMIGGIGTSGIAVANAANTPGAHNYANVFASGAWGTAGQIGTVSAQNGPINVATDGSAVVLIPYAATTTTIAYELSTNAGVSYSSTNLDTGQSSLSTQTMVSTISNSNFYFAFQSGTPAAGSIVFEAFIQATVVTATLVIGCTFFQLQCWWYPMLFLGMYTGFFIAAAMAFKFSEKGFAYFILAGSTYASLIEISLGVMNASIPIMFIAVNVAYSFRLDRIVTSLAQR